ncbi:hypothetical protein NS228_04045 [Methylobacterium indicum]|uniref:Uncharacterized protein n=1 Tax=Methylobacterium indicum TaxID=1775910 RepID=A0A0J6RE16_9HYPH|nr:hypothetical protein [Methylobacterium indicum]KMO21170.1 hypothetical protein QR78_09150 [Methylobacterium indicum]KMO26223.1 hypothetical protein QR79_03615 [Methylobacterium indicum]KTS19281.1 hypothetical protein NS229_26030 [Methylobacterium indicum]KTS41982.1 hypothetical protein NS228_04045 [Methylobacterium indicum]KTS47866.1 hypothetical protein NS230_20070 [Methylobacterium indicum]
MIQFETNASVAGQLAARGASFEARLRRAAMVLTLMVGVPLVLVWFGLIGWGVFWLARNALELSVTALTL